MLEGVSALLGYQLSLGGFCICSAVAQYQLWAQMETGRLSSQAAPQFLCPGGSPKVPLSSSGGPACTHRLRSLHARLSRANAVYFGGKALTHVYDFLETSSQTHLLTIGAYR